MAITQVEHFWQASAQVMAGCQMLTDILRDVTNKEVFTNKLGFLLEDLIDMQEVVSEKAAEIAENMTLIRQNVLQNRIWQVEDILRGMVLGQEQTAVDRFVRPLVAQQLGKVCEILDGILVTSLQRLGKEIGPTKYVPVARREWAEKIKAAGGVLDVPW